VTAILVGDRGGMTRRSNDDCEEAGTYHVIAISAERRDSRGSPSCCRVVAPVRVGSLLLACLIAPTECVAGGASVVRATLAGRAWWRLLPSPLTRLDVLATVALVAIYDPLGSARAVAVLWGDARCWLVPSGVETGVSREAETRHCAFNVARLA
jgi:hypothetical protein